jgi:hypothetical protein
LPIIKFELIMQGSDIAKGVRNMIQKGRIDVNAPKWLATIGSTGATHLYITKEGASQIEAEDSDMEEVSESDDISQMGDGEQDQADDEEQD